MDFSQAIDAAANQAVFRHQLSTARAVRFIVESVDTCTREQALDALRRATTFHK